MGTEHASTGADLGDAPVGEVLRRIDEVPGWFTRRQARRLWAVARHLPPGALAVEIGSHRGRSTLALASGLRHGRVVAVDAFVGGPRYGGLGTRAALEATLADAGVAERVRVVTARSQDLRPEWTDPIDLLHVDGKHDYLTCSDDLRWSAHLRDGGTLFVHDAFSSVGVTLALLRHVLFSRRLAYVGREGSLAHFRALPPSAADRLAMLRQLPWWLRNVAVKVTLRLRLRALSRGLRHHGADDPY